MDNENGHQMHVLGKEGDTRVIWDPANETEVSNARRTFKELIGKGFAAFSVGNLGAKGKKIDEFDPDQAKIIFTQPMAGG